MLLSHQGYCLKTLFETLHSENTLLYTPWSKLQQQCIQNVLVYELPRNNPTFHRKTISPKEITTNMGTLHETYSNNFTSTTKKGLM